MFTQIVLFSLVGLIPLGMLAFLLHVKIKSGKTLISINNLETIPFLVVGILCFFASICILGFIRNEQLILLALVMILMGIYFISHFIVGRNSVTEKGIIILDSIPSLIKWDEIQDFGIHGKKVYFKRKKGYVSMVIATEDMKDFESIISTNIRH